MLNSIRGWLGLSDDHHHHHGHDHHHNHHHHDGRGHGHTHGVVDPAIVATERGIFAIKWSFIILAITAALQMAVLFVSGSVALLADMIHNIGDATTAVPLWVAFMLARRKPTATFTYGYGRVEDLAGIIIVLIILVSALVAGYEAIDRFIHPQAMRNLGWVAMAGIVGFLGNEAVAVFRIRIGREINSAALIADGYHARIDGLTSLAVVAGALGVWLGLPLADPVIGLLITVAIVGIVWQSAKAVLTRMLDGVEPEVIDKIRHAAEHIPGIQLHDARARWLGHRLRADLAVSFDPNLSVGDAAGLAEELKKALHDHLPALDEAPVSFVERH
jgi:cation diffusion facilitator family transporter